MSFTALRSSLAAVLAAATMALCVAPPAAAQTPNQVQPYLNCIEFVGAPFLRIMAHFGYVSTYPGEVTLSVGFDNVFTPGIINRGQPTVFEPGSHDRAVSTEWQVGGGYYSLAWVVQGNASGLARLDPALLCGARSRGDWDAATQYAVGDLGSSCKATAPIAR